MKTIKTLTVGTMILCFTVLGFGGTQEQERIVEKVEVTNVEVPVRVFFKGKAVGGLNKEDFTLFVNGKKRDIHGFYEFKKKIVLNEETAGPKDTAVPVPPRLFLLIFNICDYHPDKETGLDFFFDKVFRPGDRLMVITNRFFFDDRIVSNPPDEKTKLKKVLRLETAKTTKRLNDLTRRMKSILRSYKSALKHVGFIEIKTDNFIKDYLQLVREYKSLYLTMGDKRYVQLAQYLKEQKCEKWVLNFYQIGRFFKPRLHSGFRELLMGTKYLKAGQRHLELQEVLEVEDTLLYDDLSKLFADTGAAFHTLLMESRESVQSNIAADLSYSPIVSASYDLLKEISKKTRGTFMRSNCAEEFYKEIASGDDICYMLTYVPGKEKPGRQRKIKVKVKNKKYRVYYDDGKRGAYFRQMMKKKRSEIPQIRIDRVEFNGNLLSLVVSGFKLPEPPQIRPGKPDASTVSNGANETKLPVRLQVFNAGGDQQESLFDGVEMFSIDHLEQNKVKLEINFPKVPAGIYDVFVWVGDPLTGRNDLAVTRINRE